MNREYEFPRRVIPAFSKVGESVFFVLAKSSGESFAFPGTVCLLTLSVSLYLKMWNIVERERLVDFGESDVVGRLGKKKRTAVY